MVLELNFHFISNSDVTEFVAFCCFALCGMIILLSLPVCCFLSLSVTVMISYSYHTIETTSIPLDGQVTRVDTDKHNSFSV